MRGALLLLALCACQKERIEAEHEAVATPAPSVVALASPSSASAAPAAASVSVTASAPASTAPSKLASASAKPTAATRIPCGPTTCAASQYCVRTTRGQGIPPAPGHDAVTSTSFRCSSAPPNGTCTRPGRDHQVSCVAAIPARPPRQVE